jgi:hypothetical protein
MRKYRLPIYFFSLWNLGAGIFGFMINPVIPPHSHPPVILIPLAVGMVAVACTIMIHALALGAVVSFVRHERRLRRAGASFWTDVAIVSAAIAFAFAAHLVEILLWSVLFMMCGEFTNVSSFRPLRRELHPPRLWGCGDDTVVAIARTAGSSRWNAHVRRLDCGEFRGHSTVASDEVCGPPGLSAMSSCRHRRSLVPGRVRVRQT